MTETLSCGLARGFSVIPTSLDKQPLVKSWKPYQSQHPTEQEIAEWERKQPAGWAVITGAISGIVIIDFDGERGVETMRRLGLDPHVRTGSAGYHVYVVHPGWHVSTTNSKTDKELGRRWPGLDKRADGGYAVFTGRNRSGSYEWLRPMEPDRLEVLPEDLRGYLGLLNPPTAKKPAASIEAPRRVSCTKLLDKYLRESVNGRDNAGIDLAIQLRDNGYSYAESRDVMATYAGSVSDTNTKGKREAYTEADAFRSLDSAFSRPAREPWAQPTRRTSGALAVAARVGPLELPGPTQPVLTAIIQQVINSKNVVNCFEATVVDHLARLNTGAYYIARKTLKDEFGSDLDLTLLNSAVREAKQTIVWESNSKQRTQTLAPLPVRTRGGRPAPTEVDLIPGLFNDEGNAQRLISTYGTGLLYVHAMKKWLIWDQRRWLVDDAGEARELARETMVRFHNQATKERDDAARKFANSSIDEKRITTCLSNAQDKIYARPAELDTNPYLLNFLNGTVDLRTGELRPHCPKDLITKLLHFNYNPKAQCSTFLGFMEQIMGGGPDVSEAEMDRADRMITWLQKAFGYSMTGVTNEKVIFIAHGSGDNGKSTLISLFRALLDEYSVLLQVDTLMTKMETNNSQADLADLRSARFCMTSETEEGQRLAEGKLKRITQGMGSIKATRKHENPITFTESHKLWMDANHKPVVRGNDQAIWNRLRLIPFGVTITEKDEHLPQKLMAEAEGILAWAVRGAVIWYRERLGKPPEIEAAGAEWRSKMDPLKDFLADCCVVHEDAFCKVSVLWQTYERWAEENGEKHLLSRDKFTDRMQEMGCKQGQHRYGGPYPVRSWLGIAPKADVADPEQPDSV